MYVWKKIKCKSMITSMNGRNWRLLNRKKALPSEGKIEKGNSTSRNQIRRTHSLVCRRKSESVAQGDGNAHTESTFYQQQ